MGLMHSCLHKYARLFTQDHGPFDSENNRMNAGKVP